MSLPLALVRTLQQVPPAEAWSAILEHSWQLCSQPLTSTNGSNAASEVNRRDHAIADLDLWLATAGWDLWQDYPTVVTHTADALADWWVARAPGRAVLILDALSLRELPWLLQQAAERGFTVHDARPTGAELPANTTPFANALGFAQRSALGDNGRNNGSGKGGNNSTTASHRLPGAHTESVDIAWQDCAALIGAQPDWLFWHHWPDHRLHHHDDPGKGLKTLTGEVEAQLSSDDFWSFIDRLATGRRLIITADHGYAASGQFPDAGREQGAYLKQRYKSGRATPSEQPAGDWVPPIDLAIEASRGGRHLYVNGRRKWKSQGGYPTLTHGGLSILEVLVPCIELSRKN